MVNSLEKTAAPWKAIAEMWNTHFTPPSRISKEEVEKYRGWLKGIGGGKRALVLGATPELREMLTELGYETTIVDINMEMIRAMNSVLKVKNPDEKVLNENWLESSLETGYFDVVVGDAVLPNVKWGERERLLSEVKRFLKPNGVFLTRAFCVPRKKPFANIDELLKGFSDKEPTNRASLEFVLELQILAYDPKDHQGTFSKPKEMLEKLGGDKGFNLESEKLNKLLDKVWNFWCKRFVKKVYFYAYRDEEEAEYRHFFKIQKTFEAKDQPYGKSTPMYFLEVKS